MNTVVALSQLHPQPGRREDLIALLGELAASIHAEPDLLHYSVSESLDDPDGALAVIQVYASLEAFRQHSTWMQPRIPSLLGLIAGPPQPPTLFTPLELGDHPKASFAG